MTVGSKGFLDMKLLREDVDPNIIKEEMKKTEEFKQLKKEARQQRISEIHALNQDKPRNNFCRISRWVHIMIFEFLEIEDLTIVNQVCLNLRHSVNDEQMWRS